MVACGSLFSNAIEPAGVVQETKRLTALLKPGTGRKEVVIDDIQKETLRVLRPDTCDGTQKSSSGGMHPK